jgi:hypothetical protein
MKQVLLFLALITAGCGGESGTAPTSGPIGEWYLESIGGTPLPAGNADARLVSGTLSIKSAGTFQSSYGYTFGTDPTVHNDLRNGTWIMSESNVLTMNETDHGVSLGQFNVNTVTIDWGDTGSAYLYRRK